MIALYSGEVRAGIPIKFKGNPIEINGYTLADIENIYIGFKKRPESDADDKYLAKYWKEGGILTGDIFFDGTTPTFTFKMKYSDYAKLEVGEYELVIGVKVSAVPIYLELTLKSGSNTIKIIKDKIRK